MACSRRRLSALSSTTATVKLLIGTLRGRRRAYRLESLAGERQVRLDAFHVRRAGTQLAAAGSLFARHARTVDTRHAKLAGAGFETVQRGAQRRGVTAIQGFAGLEDARGCVGHE